MSNRIRVAIGGQGRSGYNIHSKCMAEDAERFELVAVADQIAERRTDAESEFGARAHDDWRPLLEAGGFDLFVNALPSPLHVDASVEALEQGYHVVCEKPMARTVAGFDRIVAAAESNERQVFPFQNNRVQPFFEKIQQVIDSGVLGEIVHIRSVWNGYRRRWDWQTRQDLWGGSLLNTGPHAVDQALCLFGWDRAPEVFARMDCRNPFEGDAENHVTLTLWDPDRQAPQIDIDISSLVTYGAPYTYNISGTCGGLMGGARELKWKYFDPAAAPDHDMWLWSVDRKYNSEELAYTEESWRLDEAQTAGSVGYTLESMRSGPARLYDNIYEVLTSGGEAIVKLEQTRTQIAVLEEAHRQNPLPQKPQSIGFRL